MCAQIHIHHILQITVDLYMFSYSELYVVPFSKGTLKVNTVLSSVLSANSSGAIMRARDLPMPRPAQIIGCGKACLSLTLAANAV